MERYVVLKKDHFNDFITMITKEKKVFAPVAKGYNQYAFEEITSGNQISLQYIPTILPPKKYFMPQYETIATYDTSNGENMEPLVEYEEMVIFGVHTCDLAGIQCLDMVFSQLPKDFNYLTRKNNILIIGYECNAYCDDFASCKLMDNHLPNGGYDLFFTNLENGKFIIHLNTLMGENFVEKYKIFKEASNSDLQELNILREKKRKIFAINEVPIEYEKIPELFDKVYNSKVWDELGKRCLACGNCTNVCPTCYCFDFIDESNLDLKTGHRYRRWDSCQNEQFAKVAGGESFRSERTERQRHRYYRKFRYPLEKFSRLFCTGCGRCSRTCMAGIDLKETLNKLVEEQNMKNPNAGHRGSL